MLLIEGIRYASCGFEMLVGIPGCGKSTYLRKVDCNNVLVVCPDDIRRELTGNISDQSRNGDVWKLVDERIAEGLSAGRYVILDATNVNTKLRVNMLNKVKGMCPGVKCYATVFDCNPEVSKERISRDIACKVDRSNVPPEVIDRMYAMYQDTLGVIGSEGFDKVFHNGGGLDEGILLTESQESKSLSEAKRYVLDRINPRSANYAPWLVQYGRQVAMRGYFDYTSDEVFVEWLIRTAVRHDVSILKYPRPAKFILGVTRMFCDKQIIDADKINDLNETLEYISSSSHYDNIDRNLNGLSCDELIMSFADEISNKFADNKAEIGGMQFAGNTGYKIIRIKNFREASKYARYNDWCICDTEESFETNTCDGINHFYFCLKNGFEDIEAIPGKDAPLDEYGLSMISVCVKPNGFPTMITTRWNHENGGTDHALTAKQLSEVIGMNFFEAFPY